MPQSDAADVPLICDPAPGPPAFITTSRALSPVQVEQLRRALKVHAQRGRWMVSPIVETGMRCQRATGARAEWPDAEFCAA